MDSEDAVSPTATKTRLESLWREHQDSITASRGIPTSDTFTLIRQRNRYIPEKQSRFRNSLLAGVGFLELANAGDFAANIWNEIPVPTLAIILMAFGGTLALLLSCFAFADLTLSRRNFHVLREERRILHGRKRFSSRDTRVIRDLDTRLKVNLRDTGTELINRIIMDSLMGFGAVAIGVGTLVAIGGQNARVYLASNLLSGYIGNVPLALYALFNAAWCSYLWMTAHHHKVIGAKVFGYQGLGLRLQHRARNIQIYAFAYGLTGICGGVGSLLVATRWWGYVILIPVIISSVVCNYIWRRKVGYDRPPLQELPSLEQDSLVRDLEYISAIRQELQYKSRIFPCQMTSNATKLSFFVDFITSNDLFEDFSTSLLNDPELRSSLFVDSGLAVTISAEKLLKADAVYISRILDIAQVCIQQAGSVHFRYQERYMLDILSCFLSMPEAMVASEKMEKD